MRALLYDNFGSEPYVETVSDPGASDDGVVVRVLASGICRSDWHGWMGHDPDIQLPHVPGHELAGEIIEVGRDIRNFKLGDRVTVPFVSGCGKCSECLSGNQQICDHQFQPGFSGWGSFAEYVSLRYADQNLAVIPDSIGNVAAASLGCRFITSFRALVDVGRVRGGEWVAVFGCGGVGLSAIMIATGLGAQAIAIDVNEDALKLAAKCGAIHRINAAKENPVEIIKSITKGGSHVSLDALGSAQTCRDSIHSLRKRGRHIQVGLMEASDRDPPIPMHEVIAKEITILGSHGMQAYRYGDVFEMIAKGSLDPKSLVTQTIKLDEASVVLTHLDSFRHHGITVIDKF